MLDKPFPAYRGSEPYVFVCYAHEDDDSVYRELRWLRDQGIRVWYDEGISPGEEWSQELGQAIEKADRVVFFVTAASVESRHCRNEIHFAQNHDVPVVAVHLAETKLPQGLELSISASQAILKYEMSESAYRIKFLEVFNGDTTKLLSPADLRHAPRVRPRWAIGLLILVALAGSLVWNFGYRDTDSINFDRSVSVQAFSFIGTNPDLAAYTASLEGDLTSYLAQFQELRLLSGSSTAQSLEAGNNLPSYLVQSSTQDERAGRRVRVNLVRTLDQETIWSEIFDVSEKDDLPELAATISRFIRLQLVQDHQCETTRRTSRSREAGNAACEALAQNYRMNQKGGFDAQLLRSLAEHIIQLDPGLWEGYWHLSVSHLMLGLTGQIHWRDASEAMHTALDEAAAINPDNPLIEWHRGTAAMFFDLDYEQAEKHFLRAIEIDPIHPNARWFHSSLGKLALLRGNIAVAMDHYRRAVRSYDSDARIYAEYTQALNIAGDHEGALDAASKGLELTSEGSWYITMTTEKINALVATGDMELAIETLSGIRKSNPLPQLVLIGQEDEVKRQLSELEKLDVPPSGTMAIGYAAIGDHDRAFVWLDKAIDERIYLYGLLLRVNSIFSEMRNDVRWDTVMQKLAELEVAGEDRVQGGN